MAETLAEWIGTGTDLTEGDRQGARAALRAIAVPELVEALTMAERVIRAGNSFHSVARFFADGSPEQEYVLSLGSEP